jgi:hypothetical protein
MASCLALVPSRWLLPDKIRASTCYCDHAWNALTDTYHDDLEGPRPRTNLVWNAPLTVASP